MREFSRLHVRIENIEYKLLKSTRFCNYLVEKYAVKSVFQYSALCRNSTFLDSFKS